MNSKMRDTMSIMDVAVLGVEGNSFTGAVVGADGAIWVHVEDASSQYADALMTVEQVREYANKLLNLAAEVAAEQDTDNDSR